MSTALSVSSSSHPQKTNGTSTASSTALTVWAHSPGLRAAPPGSAPTSFRLMRSTLHSSTSFCAHSAGALIASPIAPLSMSGQSGTTSAICPATTGRWGIAPSDVRHGSVVSPPTVTVRPRVPPSSLVAPIVTVLIPFVHFSLTSTISIILLLSCPCRH